MRIFIAEAVGTAILVIGGVGTAVFDGSRVGPLGIAFAFGLSLLCAAYLIGPISGCHVNPAVTAAMAAARRIEPKQVLVYWGAQIVGGLFGALLIFGVSHGSPGFPAVGKHGRTILVSASQAGFASNGYGAHSPSGFNMASVMLAEVVATAVFALIVVATTSSRFPAAVGGVVAGLALTLVHLVLIPVDNASVNPARSLAAAVFQGGWALSQVWLFLVFPLIGGALAGLAGHAMLQIQDAAAVTEGPQGGPEPGVPDATLGPDAL
ncbi:aquaporin Z [Streptacidiphilus sp. P02-A3a]|nr:aquaporin Z [Streptacidiphilus sp. P02-A3a]